MAENSLLYTAVYDDLTSARADLDAVEEFHKDELIGDFDAAIVENREGQSHIVKRMDRPRIRIIPEVFGGGELPRKELKEAAQELSAGQAGLIVVGETTLEKGFDRAVMRAANVVKHEVDATTDEIAKELEGAFKSS